MELVINAEDFRRLSPATRKELLALLMGGEGDGEAMPGPDDYDTPLPPEMPGGAVSAGKRVFPINPTQAAELLSNLAEKSRQTLRLFAVGERVAVDELIGEGRPYKDMNDLKRSFVGAVNRRLRTVVGDRSAVLFSSDRDRQRIRVLPLTASALRQALGIPEAEMDDVFDGMDFDAALDEEQEG